MTQQIRVRRQMADGKYKLLEEMTPEEVAEMEAAQAAAKADMERRRLAQEELTRTAVSRHITALLVEAEDKKAEADQLTRMLAEFPDLRRHVGRWNKVAYYSKSANTRVTDFEQRGNCGCCPDRPLEVWPYLETPHGRVYSDPPMVFVGHRNPETYGDVPDTGWDQPLRAAGIPEGVIERVGLIFEKPDDESEDSDE